MRTRVVGLAAAAALTFAACGQGEPPNLPALGANASAESMAAGDAADAKRAAGGSTMADMSMRANIRYELADGVTVNVARGKAYKFGSVDKAAVAKLAKAFGVSGDVQSDEYGYTVGVSKDASVSSDQRTPASLYVGKDGQFSYSGSYEPVATTACAEAEAREKEALIGGDAVAPVDSGCAAPTTTVPTKPMPSADAAKQKVTDVFRAGGVDLDNAKVTTADEGDFIGIQVIHQVGGLPVEGYQANASVNRDSDIVYASGFLTTPDSVGDYDLASLERAVERLNEGMGQGGTRDLAATSDVGAAEPAIAIDEPMPSEPTEPSEPTVVKLTAVKVGLMVSYASNELWLTPAYHFSGDEGAQVTAAAAADKYFPEPEPVQTDPAPADGGGSSGGSSGGSDGDPGAVDPVAPEYTRPPVAKE